MLASKFSIISEEKFSKYMYISTISPGFAIPFEGSVFEEFESSYDNDINNADQYGMLYNGHAVVDDRDICPESYHIPTYEEWILLSNYQ
mgnify:CR=1 FL=1